MLNRRFETVYVTEILRESDLIELFEQTGLESRFDFWDTLRSYRLVDHAGLPVARSVGRLIPRLRKRFLFGRSVRNLLAKEGRLTSSAVSGAEKSRQDKWIKVIGRPSEHLVHLVNDWASFGGEEGSQATEILAVYQRNSNSVHKLIFASASDRPLVLVLAPGEVSAFFELEPVLGQAQEQSLEGILGAEANDLLMIHGAGVNGRSDRP